MREEILLNERYGAVEISKDGMITGYNENALVILGDIYGLNRELKGLSITGLSGTDKEISYDPAIPEKIISSIDGIKHIDSIFYKDTESVIVRFAKDNEVFTTFFDMIKLSSSLYLELDSCLNIIFMNGSLIKTAVADKSEIYGSNISIISDKTGTAKINSAADLYKNKIIDCMKIDEVQFNFDGISRYYDMEVLPIHSSAGKFSGILCYLIDNSAEKKINKLNRKIRRMSAVANFAGGIAHDYNNALTAVLGNISLAKMDTENNSELDELLRDAESAALKIKVLTERLGMFARGMKPAKVKTNIKKLIESIIPEVLSDYKGHYKITVQDEMTHPEIDPELIGEAVKHIIENAVEAADKPDGEIAIELEERDVDKEAVFRETSIVSGRYIIISVTDNGSGLGSISSGEIFDPYVTTKPGREGLGLALAYTILKRHRGFISVDSSGSGGADFKIYIPLF
ncbi:MAG TPA: ATP-binding protein [Spirochaetota bacterium]|nr:ATP-binding protein [Spirochaetota bacterium]HPS85743.1 ATP-binding protein [Spirochaetota bacterium]